MVSRTLVAPGRWLAAGTVLSFSIAVVGQEVPSRAPNIGGIINTRHNLTQSFLGGDAGWMQLSRNNYGEVCVYCHTPHGASGVIAAPLWNRTTKPTNYATYDLLNTSSLTQTVSQPGANSLTCLSCHDGQTAIDSVINMPGSGRYNPAQASSQDNAFLNSWPGGPGSQFFGGHGTLEVSDAAFNRYGECQNCHSAGGPQHDPSLMPAFDAFYISTDLRNDHPVGITYPPPSNTDFNVPNAISGTLRYFDRDGNGRADKHEVRLFNTGGGHEVECATCHDPHGVPSGGPGSLTTFIPTFLRVSNVNSSLCLTCHNK